MKNRNSSLKYLKFILVILILGGCKETGTTQANKYEEEVRARATEYYKTFSERSDWVKFCSFYREDVDFKDISLQLELDSLWKFKRFYKWDEEGDRFKKLFPEQESLNVQSLVVDGNMAVAKGHLNPFYYDGVLVNTDWGMEFTIWLRFDENMKIVEQIDWMEYDPITLENTITRCRENGFRAIPDWLDLSPKD